MTRNVARKVVIDKRSGAPEIETGLSRRDDALTLGVRITGQEAREARERKQIIRGAQDRYLRKCGHDPDRLRQIAADLRSEKDLCPHCDDPRNYTSHEDAAADLETPGVICGECGKERLRVQFISPKPLAEIEPDENVREALMENILR